jgi:hypothetical protein
MRTNYLGAFLARCPLSGHGEIELNGEDGREAVMSWSGRNRNVRSEQRDGGSGHLERKRATLSAMLLARTALFNPGRGMVKLGAEMLPRFLLG